MLSRETILEIENALGPNPKFRENVWKDFLELLEAVDTESLYVILQDMQEKVAEVTSRLDYAKNMDIIKLRSNDSHLAPQFARNVIPYFEKAISGENSKERLDVILSIMSESISLFDRDLRSEIVKVKQDIEEAGWDPEYKNFHKNREKFYKFVEEMGTETQELVDFNMNGAIFNQQNKDKLLKTLRNIDVLRSEIPSWTQYLKNLKYPPGEEKTQRYDMRTIENLYDVYPVETSIRKILKV